MSLIAKELVKHEKILEFTSTYEDYLRKDTKSPFWLVNTNRLVRFKEGVDGLKTGFTDEAGYCLTATMKKDNMRLITVVMKEENTSKRSADTTKMLDYGFNIYMVQTILDEKTTIEKKKVELGKTLTTEIVPKENITILNKKSEEQKNITYSLAHTKWNCKYHIVFAPKYRRKVFYQEKRESIRDIIRTLCQWKGVEIIEGEICPDHIHLLISIPPKMSVSGFMVYLKGKSSLMIFQKYGNMKFAYRNREFWCKGYYVDTVGKNTAAIKSYIANQLKQDKEMDQISLFDPRDPFTGSK